MALANWLTSYHREAPEDHIKCKWPISTAVISRGVLGIVDRSQLNRAFGKASGTLPPSVRDAAGYTLKKIYVAGDPSPWNFLQFKDCVVDARDMADLLRCIDWTIADEEGEEGGRPASGGCRRGTCRGAWAWTQRALQEGCQRRGNRTASISGR